MLPLEGVVKEQKVGKKGVDNSYVAEYTQKHRALVLVSESHAHHPYYVEEAGKAHQTILF